MFNIANFAGNVFASGARKVLKEARDAIVWAKKIVTTAAKMGLRIAARVLSMLQKLIARLQKVIVTLEKWVKDIEKGKMPEMKALRKLVEQVADGMGKMTHVADRIAAWVDTKFTDVFELAQKKLSEIAKRVTTLAKKMVRGVSALSQAITAALRNETLKPMKDILKKALDWLLRVNPALKFLQDAKARAARVITEVDPDRLAGKVSKFAMTSLDALMDNARFFAEAATLGETIAFLRKLLAAVSRGLKQFTDTLARNLLAGLEVTLRRVLAELEELYKEVMGAAAEAMKHRVVVGAEAKVLESRVGKARSESEIYARTLKRMVW